MPCEFNNMQTLLKRGYSMASVRFPYDLTSRSALIELIRRDRPYEDIRDDFIEFEDLVFVPTPLEPGRTSIEMVNRITNRRSWYIYRRLDIDLVLRQYLPPERYYVSIDILGTITSRKIVTRINELFNLKLSDEDIDINDRSLTTHNATSFIFRMKDTSCAYYGQCIIYVNTTPEELDTRITEDNARRTDELGRYRIVE